VRAHANEVNNLTCLLTFVAATKVFLFLIWLFLLFLLQIVSHTDMVADAHFWEVLHDHCQRHSDLLRQHRDSDVTPKMDSIKGERKQKLSPPKYTT